jgi:predicted rRNA methylase
MRENEYLYGINTILSLLRVNSGNRKIYNIFIHETKNLSDKLKEVYFLSENKGIKIARMDKSSFADIIKKSYVSDACLNSKSKNFYFDAEKEVLSSQGIAAEVSEYNYPDFEIDLKRKFSGRSTIVMLDGITDVGNFGSILRNCSAFGMDGIVVPNDRSVTINRRVSKISSGAMEETRIYRVTNLNRTISKLKESGFWIYGTTLKNEKKEIMRADKIKYNFPSVVIFGSEDKGISRLVAENCDVLVKIGMESSIQSLNVSVASGIILYSLWIQKDNENPEHRN